MKTLLLSPRTRNPKTPTSAMEDSTQSYYFPGCRKDANCSCQMCLDSFNATLDLMSMSVQKSSLSKFSASKLRVEKTPISIDPTLRTPESKPKLNRISTPPTLLRSTAKTGCSRTNVTEKKKIGLGLRCLKWVLVVGAILGLELGFSFGVLQVLKPRLKVEIVRGVIEKSLVVKSLSERLMLIQQGLGGFVDGKVSRCNLGGSTWTINQDGLMLSSQCTLHKSAAEEVIIWGWPLQTSGLLTSGFSSRYFSLLSGRVTQWTEGKIMSIVQETNATWTQRKWSASVVQLDPNTWIIEYRRSMLLENSSLFLATFDLFKFGFSSLIVRMKQKFWLLPVVRNQCFATSMSEIHLSIPT